LKIFLGIISVVLISSDVTMLTSLPTEVKMGALLASCHVTAEGPEASLEK